MNLSNQSASFRRASGRRTSGRKPPHGESGYALIALIAIMTFALILTTAAAPQIKKEMQREREEEMLWRAEQVVYAIERYGQYPMGKDGLVKLATGIQAPGKVNKLKYLRTSALCDPMVPCSPGSTNWQMIHQGDSLAKDFLTNYKAILEREGKQNTQQYGKVIGLLSLIASGVLLPNGQAGNGQPPPPIDQGNGQGEGKEDDPSRENRQVFGVVSKKTDRMFRNYYEVEQYNRAFFFPAIPMRAGGFISPLMNLAGGGIVGGTAPGPDPRWPNGGVFIGDKCYGGVAPICRDESGKGIPCPPQ